MDHKQADYVLMRLSILCPTTPLRRRGGDMLGFVRLLLMNLGPPGVGRLTYTSIPKNTEHYAGRVVSRDEKGCRCIGRAAVLGTVSAKTVLVTVGDLSRIVTFEGGREALIQKIKLKFSDILKKKERIYLQV